VERSGHLRQQRREGSVSSKRRRLPTAAAECAAKQSGCSIGEWLAEVLAYSPGSSRPAACWEWSNCIRNRNRR
jgi:hypothetical protein